MSKRFTDTTKWDGDGFQSLSPKMKLAWIYLCDKCNHAGIWKVNMSLMSFQIGSKYTLEELIASFKGKLILVKRNRIFVEPFYDFQYANAKDTFAAKVSALKELENYGLLTESGEIKKGQSYDSPMTVPGVSQESTSIGIGTIIINNKIKRENFDFENLYHLYPLKKGKQKGLDKCRTEIKTRVDYDKLKNAVENYRKLCEVEKTDKKYIKHFSTFMNCWRDYLDDDVGTCEIDNTETELNEYRSMLGEI